MIKYNLDLITQYSFASIHDFYSKIVYESSLNRLVLALKEPNILLQIDTVLLRPELLQVFRSLENRLIKIKRVEAYHTFNTSQFSFFDILKAVNDYQVEECQIEMTIPNNQLMDFNYYGFTRLRFLYIYMERVGNIKTVVNFPPDLYELQLEELHEMHVPNFCNWPRGLQNLVLIGCNVANNIQEFFKYLKEFPNFLKIKKTRFKYNLQKELLDFKFSQIEFDLFQVFEDTKMEDLEFLISKMDKKKVNVVFERFQNQVNFLQPFFMLTQTFQKINLTLNCINQFTSSVMLPRVFKSEPIVEQIKLRLQMPNDIEHLEKLVSVMKDLHKLNRFIIQTRQYVSFSQEQTQRLQQSFNFIENFKIAKLYNNKIDTKDYDKKYEVLEDTNFEYYYYFKNMKLKYLYIEVKNDVEFTEQDYQKFLKVLGEVNPKYLKLIFTGDCNALQILLNYSLIQHINHVQIIMNKDIEDPLKDKVLLRLFQDYPNLHEKFQIIPYSFSIETTIPASIKNKVKMFKYLDRNEIKEMLIQYPHLAQFMEIEDFVLQQHLQEFRDIFNI